MSDALVSIITPTLNQAAYLEETLRSVAAQTHPHLEHLVLDGGSQDGSVAILERWRDRPRLHWTTEADQGMYDAINHGLRLARGEIIGYLNSDDLYFPWTVQAAVDAFERDPSIDLVYGDALRLDEMRGVLIPWLQPAVPVWTRLVGGSFVQPTVFWRRRVSDDLGGFDPALRLAGDLDFWYRAVAGGLRFGRIDEFLAIDRAHPAAQSVARAAALDEESRTVRGRYAGPGQAPLARGRIRLARRVLWARLVWAIRSRSGRSWGRSIKSLAPSVSLSGLPRAFFSSAGRSGPVIQWRVDPHAVAIGGDSD
jgi:glycosyltransferase involved in cell wall biosynthesis